MEREEFRLCGNLPEKYGSNVLSGKLPNGVRRIALGTKIKSARVLDYENSDGKSESAYVKTEVSNKRRKLFGSLEYKKIESYISENKVIRAAPEYSSLNRMLALLCLKEGNELKAIEHLIKSHAVTLQSSIFHRFQKTIIRSRYDPDLELGLGPDCLKIGELGRSLKTKLSELPPEWYTLQLTTRYEPANLTGPESGIVNSMRPLHITVLPSGPNAIDPICITIPQLKSEDYDAVQEVVRILKNNKDDLSTKYNENTQYWSMRAKQNSNMLVAMAVVQNDWLREWKILLVADPLEETRLVKDMRAMIDKLIADDFTIVNLPARSKWLLKKIATCSCYLTKAEIARAVLHVLGGNKKLASNIILSIYGKLQTASELLTQERKTLVLIVNESLDHVPFESMTLLANHPVTRFPSFNVAYAMFKEHENTIVKGCKIIHASDYMGSFIVNPGHDLKKTEKRMKLFIEYWLPKWSGTYRITPDEKSFGQALVNYDILLYVGHGSGIQYMTGNQIEKLRVRALPLLFGCSSLKLLPNGGRFAPVGVSSRYITARSPCVLGTLWEITDGDIDRLTTWFISNWISSTVATPWSDVDLTVWTAGTLAFKTNPTRKLPVKTKNEPEMLRAIAKSKDVCSQHMTAAAIIVRGLPIKLVYK